MRVRKLTSAAVASLGLVAGLSGFAGAMSTSGSISNTGAYSHNKVKSTKTTTVKVKNDNDIKVKNYNDQNAETGDATVKYNTTAGDVSTGAATNRNHTNIAANVDNSASSATWTHALSDGSGDTHGTINQTGYNSNNAVTSKETTKIDVKNDNDIKVTNTNKQTATSGDATVKYNTTVGSVTTGDATNTNNTTVKVDVSN
jgi:hypothetical protein